MAERPWIALIDLPIVNHGLRLFAYIIKIIHEELRQKTFSKILFK